MKYECQDVKVSRDDIHVHKFPRIDLYYQFQILSNFHFSGVPMTTFRLFLQITIDQTNLDAISHVCPLNVIKKNIALY